VIAADMRMKIRVSIAQFHLAPKNTEINNINNFCCQKLEAAVY